MILSEDNNLAGRGVDEGSLKETTDWGLSAEAPSLRDDGATLTSSYTARMFPLSVVPRANFFLVENRHKR
jgi:hypothetical protein